MTKAKTKPADSSLVPSLSITDLQKLCSEPVPIEFSFRDNRFRIMARRLTPFESDILKLRVDEVRPPLIKGKTEADDRLDVENQDFRRKRVAVLSEVRALAIFWTIPEIQAMAKDLAPRMYDPSCRPAIVELINGSAGKPGLFTEEVTELVYAAIQNAEVKLGEVVNFFSPAGEATLQP